MKRPNAFIVLLEKSFPYRFFVAKLTRVPGLKQLLQRLLFHQTNLTYLLKDSVVELHLNTPIAPPDTVVLPSQVVEHFIRQASRRFIMDFCLCRQSNHCKDYPVELGCLFLGEAVKDISPAYGREVSLQEALDHVDRCRKAGLIHLIGRDTIDKTWLQVKNGEQLLTICNCCSCCCLWKWIPDLHPSIQSQIKRMPGVRLTVDDHCTGCGTCAEQCFIHAITITGGKARITEDCRGCGRCVDACPSHAIQLHIDEPLFCEHTIDRIASAVDISSEKP
ncbi:MAG: 4Fe-4S binding protein [Candidatus Thermoplasmatota archaeon]|nr:4Fe-4S binding protein [Candidatus Thermoplasmatota archaeon]